MAIIEVWWKDVNVLREMYISMDQCKKFFVKKTLAKDNEVAEKLIIMFIGKIERIEFQDFYKLFSRGIFRVSLIDMLQTIE